MSSRVVPRRRNQHVVCQIKTSAYSEVDAFESFSDFMQSCSWLSIFIPLSFVLFVRTPYFPLYNCFEDCLCLPSLSPFDDSLCFYLAPEAAGHRRGLSHKPVILSQKRGHQVFIQVFLAKSVIETFAFKFPGIPSKSRRPASS